MRYIIALSILTGCTDVGSSSAPPTVIDLPCDPEVYGLSWELIDRMEDHFGGRVGITADGEYDDGEHYIVTHDGQSYIVVYDDDEDRILNVSKAGTLKTGESE